MYIFGIWNLEFYIMHGEGKMSQMAKWGSQWWPSLGRARTKTRDGRNWSSR